MEIEILELRILPEGRALKAFCDIKVNGWTINDFRIVQKNGQKMCVLGPQVSWVDPGTREIRYKGILTTPPEEKQMIELKILSAYREEMEKKHGELKK